MDETDLHLALKMRVKTLGLRITALKNTMSEATDAKRSEKLGELHELGQRHKDLDQRLRQVDREGPGLRQAVKADLSLLADNIQGGLDSLMFSIDAHYVADEHAMSRPKP
jgi:hypothetical protein